MRMNVCRIRWSIIIEIRLGSLLRHALGERLENLPQKDRPVLFGVDTEAKSGESKKGEPVFDVGFISMFER